MTRELPNPAHLNYIVQSLLYNFTIAAKKIREKLPRKKRRKNEKKIKRQKYEVSRNWNSIRWTRNFVVSNPRAKFIRPLTTKNTLWCTIHWRLVMIREKKNEHYFLSCEWIYLGLIRVFFSFANSIFFKITFFITWNQRWKFTFERTYLSWLRVNIYYFL